MSRGAVVRGAIAVSLLVASTARGQPTPEQPADPTSEWHHAQALERRTEYREAALAYEAYARRCFARPTAEAEDPSACAQIAPALERAFDLLRALGETDAAERVARSYLGHLLYAEPRSALRIGYELSLLHLDAGRPQRAEDALAELIAAHPDLPPGQAILLDAARARIAAAEDRHARAAFYARRVEARYADEATELAIDGAVPLARVREAVADVRLLRAEAQVRRFLSLRSLPARPSGPAAQWWSRVLTPWRVRVERRLLIARMELERVYELGSPRHSVEAAGRIGEMYAHFASLHAALTLPDDEFIRVLVHRGHDRLGYDDARAHLQTCIEWANHHRVARAWAARCERALHELDPYAYPLPAELHGDASYANTTMSSNSMPIVASDQSQ